MAKLKARGREVIFEVERESGDREKDPANWKKQKRAVTSDGTILSQLVVNIATPYRASGFDLHNYGWKVEGKAKPGLTAEDLLELYCQKGFRIVSAPGLPRVEKPYYDALTAMATMGGKVPTRSRPPEAKILRTVEVAAKQKASKEKAAVKRAAVASSKNGPGFYVTNVDLKSAFSITADHAYPFADYESAETSAIERLRHFVSLKLDYLLPVKIIEASSRMDAILGKGHTWWINGKKKGPPVDPRQMRLPGVNGNL